MLNLNSQEKMIIAAYSMTLSKKSAEFYFNPVFSTERCSVMMRKPIGEETYETISFELPNLHRELIRQDHWYTEREIFG